MSLRNQKYVDPSDLGTALANTRSTTGAITATPSGTQSTGVLLTSRSNRVAVCATAGDSVRLPAAIAGRRTTVFNKGAASLNVFPAVGDRINAASVNAAYALAVTKSVELVCCVGGTWDTLLTA